MLIRAAAFFGVLGCAFAAPALGCGVASDCAVGERSYRIAVPEGDGPYPAIYYMHGYRGSPAGVMNSGIRRMAERLGVALIAPKSGDAGWMIRNSPRRGLVDDSIELDGFDAILADALDRFPIDDTKIVAAGFSGGGMMTWTLACHRADRFVGVVPIAGVFWAPIPDHCPSAVIDVIHIHGTADTVVPMEGRPIADTAQGDVRDTLAMARAAAGATPDGTVDGPSDLSCEGASSDDVEIVLCLHEGGHSIRAEWLAWAYARLTGA